MPRFKGFNFKLVVVEQLMYIDETLKPQFWLSDLLKEQGLGDDPQDYAWKNNLDFQVIPQAREFFESLEIDERLLSGVEELCMDGGNQVYQECAPVWDGEDDLFDIHSLADLALLPNLKRVLGSEFLGQTLLAELRSRGVEDD